jgi:hypothetical protein
MKPLRYLSLFGVVLMIIGFSGFIGAGILCCLLGGSVPSWMELPMGEMGSIVVDRAGNIYCASSSYGRIQVFDRAGKFVRGMFIGGGGGRITMYFDSTELLHVYVSKARTLYIFNPDGTLVKKGKDEVASTIDSSINRHARDREGNTYSTVSPSFYPRVRKTTPEGKESIIVAVPLYLLIFQGPIPAWFIAAIGMGLAALADSLEKKKKSRAKLPSSRKRS